MSDEEERGSAPPAPPADAPDIDPRGDRPWEQKMWSVAGLATVASLLAAIASDAGLRSFALVTMLLAAAGLTWLASGYQVPRQAREAMAGSGYLAHEEGHVRLLHFAVMVLYNAGVFVLILAVMFRFQVVNADVGTVITAPFPLLMGLFIMLLAAAVVMQVAWTGGIRTAWYTRAHGTYLGVIVGLVTVLGIGAAIASWAGKDGLPIGGLTIGATDVSVLALFGLLGVATQLLFAAGLPTIFDLLGSTAKAADKTGRGTPPIVYALFLTVGVTAVAGFFFTQFDLAQRLGSFKDERVVYLLALLPVGVGAFFLFSTLAIWREGRRDFYTKKVTTKLRNDLLVYGLSTGLGTILVGLIVMVLTDRVDYIGPFPVGRDMIKDLTALTILATSAPIGIYLHSQTRRIDAIETRLPDLLNDLAESRRAGLTLPAALRSSSRNDYGELGPEVEKMADQVAWGISFNDALEQFAERVKTNLVRRSARLVVEASRTGGSVAEILKAAATDAYEIKAIESDRRTTMLTYLIVIYVVYFVFLVVLAALDVQFLPELLRAQEATQGGAATFGTGIDGEALSFIFFNAAMVQSIGNGIVGGVLAEARVTAGFRHVALMTGVAWIMFRFLLPIA